MPFSGSLKKSLLNKEKAKYFNNNKKGGHKMDTFMIIGYYLYMGVLLIA